MKKDSVDLKDLKRFSIEETFSKKQKSTDFFEPSSDTRIASTKKDDHDVLASGSRIEHIFYSENNSFKLCAEGAIRNLWILHCSNHDMDLFGNIVTSPLHSILQALDESFVPKAVQNFGGEWDSIKKSLWILCKKFKFDTTSQCWTSLFQNLKQTIDFLMNVKCPLLLAVKGKHDCYDHIIITWRGIIIDYESKYTFPLTNDSLRQICGVNTTFDGISCGYGILPPPHICNSIDNAYVKDMGYAEYCIKDSPIRKYYEK
jgi:hypothetical protein